MTTTTADAPADPVTPPAASLAPLAPDHVPCGWCGLPMPPGVGRRAALPALVFAPDPRAARGLAPSATSTPDPVPVPLALCPGCWLTRREAERIAAALPHLAWPLGGTNHAADTEAAESILHALALLGRAGVVPSPPARYLAASTTLADARRFLPLVALARSLAWRGTVAYDTATAAPVRPWSHLPRVAPSSALLDASPDASPALADLVTAWRALRARADRARQASTDPRPLPAPTSPDDWPPRDRPRRDTAHVVTSGCLMCGATHAAPDPATGYADPWTRRRGGTWRAPTGALFALLGWTCPPCERAAVRAGHLDGTAPGPAAVEYAVRAHVHSRGGRMLDAPEHLTDPSPSLRVPTFATVHVRAAHPLPPSDATTTPATEARRASLAARFRAIVATPRREPWAFVDLSRVATLPGDIAPGPATAPDDAEPDRTRRVLDRQTVTRTPATPDGGR